MTLRERYEKLEPRERRLLTILLGVFGALLFLALPLGISGVLSSRRDENTEMRDLIQSIQAARATVAERKARHDALLARYSKQAPALGGFIEEAARESGLPSPESQDRPDIPHGKRYTERLTMVKLHKVGMLGLARMLEKIEQSGYPVAITRLNIKPRSGEPDSYEVELGVSAYERKPDAPAPGAPAGSGSAKEAGGEP